MVSQTEDNAASLPEEPDFEKIASEMDAAGEFVDSSVEDNTPEPAPEPVEEVEGTETRTPEPQPEEAEPEPSPQPEGEPAAEKPSRLYDDPEFRKWQSQKDRELSEARKQLEEINAEKARAESEKQVNEQVESHLNKEVEDLVAKTGYAREDIEKAVRDPARVQQTREAFQQRVRNQQLEQAIHVAGKNRAADLYSQQYNVAPDDREALMDAETPQGMERIAKRLGQASTAKNGATESKRTAVPRETTETAPVGTASNAASKPGFYELLDSAMEKPYSSMNDDERRAVDMAHSGNFPEN